MSLRHFGNEIGRGAPADLAAGDLDRWARRYGLR